VTVFWGILFDGFEVGAKLGWYEFPCDLDKDGISLGCSEGDSDVSLAGCDFIMRVGIDVGFALPGAELKYLEG
jgi:hypothetical protein